MNELVQRSPEWLLARAGSLGASEIGKALMRKLDRKTNERTGERFDEAVTLLYEKAAERITGVPAGQVNSMHWGNQCEAQARADYALWTNLPVIQVGLIEHPSISNAHASPDCLVGDDGGAEIKCPTSGKHLRTLMTKAVPEDNLPQVHWSMACSGRRWWDFVTYDPRFPSNMQMLVIRIERDQAVIDKMEAEAIKWLSEVDDIVERARAL